MADEENAEELGEPRLEGVWIWQHHKVPRLHIFFLPRRVYKSTGLAPNDQVLVRIRVDLTWGVGAGLNHALSA